MISGPRVVFGWVLATIVTRYLIFICSAMPWNAFDPILLHLFRKRDREEKNSFSFVYNFLSDFVFLFYLARSASSLPESILPPSHTSLIRLIWFGKSPQIKRVLQVLFNSWEKPQAKNEANGHTNYFLYIFQLKNSAQRHSRCVVCSVQCAVLCAWLVWKWFSRKASRTRFVSALCHAHKPIFYCLRTVYPEMQRCVHHHRWKAFEDNRLRAINMEISYRYRILR